MRVLSFIPALLLAATSFVAATPLASPVSGTVSVAASARDVSIGNFNEASDAVQNVISFLQNAQQDIAPLNDQLDQIANVAKRSIPDPKTVSGIVVQINTILSTTVTKVNAVVKVNLSGADLTTLGVAIYTLFALILSVLDTLVKIVLLLGPGAAGPLRGPIVALLYTVLALVSSLGFCVVGSLVVILGPVFALVSSTVNLMLTTTVNIN